MRLICKIIGCTLIDVERDVLRLSERTVVIMLFRHVLVLVVAGVLLLEFDIIDMQE